VSTNHPEPASVQPATIWDPTTPAGDPRLRQRLGEDAPESRDARLRELERELRETQARIRQLEQRPLTPADWRRDLETQERLVGQQFGDGGHLPVGDPVL
jgi:hypothetical protein